MPCPQLDTRLPVVAFCAHRRVILSERHDVDTLTVNHHANEFAGIPLVSREMAFHELSKRCLHSLVVFQTQGTVLGPYSTYRDLSAKSSDSPSNSTRHDVGVPGSSRAWCDTSSFREPHDLLVNCLEIMAHMSLKSYWSAHFPLRPVPPFLRIKANSRMRIVPLASVTRSPLR